MPLSPLSHSILGVEPLDEFIREIADFIHHMIVTRSDIGSSDAKVEVEMKVGVIRDRTSGQRLKLPVLVETSQYASLLRYCCAHVGRAFSFAIKSVLAPDSMDIRFESNMSKACHIPFDRLKPLTSMPGDT